ncbi:MAG: cation:proton antiporter [Acidobacteriota bacterium]
MASLNPNEFMQQAVAVLGGAVGVVYLSARLRVPAVVGLVLSGMVIGPSGLGWIEDPQQVEMLAEIGVVLLLFIIGLELSVDQLRELGRPFLLGGALQAGLTFAGAAALAMVWAPSLRTAIFAGMAIVLSSTAVVLKLYDQRRETHTPQGNVVLGVLLFQDFLIVPMIVLTPVLAGTTEATAGELLLRFAGALGAIAAVVFVARVVMPVVLHQLVALRVRELFMLTGLLICLGTAWFTESLGFSLALGAFLAGILLSETEYSHQVVADIVPFRDVFASLFFISIGMLVDLSFAASRLPLLISLALALVVLKALAAFLAVRLTGYPTRIGVIAGLGLAQIGEFSFVLMEVGRANGLLLGDGFQILLVSAVLTLVITPTLVHFAPAAGEKLSRWLNSPPDGLGPNREELNGHVIVVGYGVNGSLLCRVLSEARIPYVVLELNSETVRRARGQGVPIVFGDSTRPDMLHHLGIERAQAIVFAISDAQALERSVPLSRRLAPSIAIIVRTRTVKEIEPLRALGADEVVAEEFESAIEIFTHVLERFHVPRNVIRAQTRVLRGEGYQMLRVPSERRQVSTAVLDALEAGTTDVYRLPTDGALAGRTLRDLDLRRHTGATVIAVVRGEESYANPSADQVLEDGDCLVLVGGHSEIDDAFQFLDRSADGS